MDSRVVSGIVGGIISVAVLTWLSARVRAGAADGALRYGWGLALLGFCCLAFVGFAASAFVFDDDVWTDRGEFIAVVGLIVGFGLGAIYSFGEYFYVRGRYDDQGIEFRTPWTGAKAERWRDLRAVTFNRQMNWYVLEFASGKKVRLSTLLSGHGGVLAKLEALGHRID